MAGLFVSGMIIQRGASVYLVHHATAYLLRAARLQRVRGSDDTYVLGESKADWQDMVVTSLDDFMVIKSFVLRLSISHAQCSFNVVIEDLAPLRNFICEFTLHLLQVTMLRKFAGAVGAAKSGNTLELCRAILCKCCVDEDFVHSE